MGDSSKIICKDKRHRSSSSISGAGIEGTRSERKLDLRGLIPEVGDYFAVAESRCDHLQDKIELLKVLKKRKKLNKRSMTRVAEGSSLAENPVPFISVQTQPKTRVSGAAARLRRGEGVLAGPAARGYVDPATIEQHRMLGHVWTAHRPAAQNSYQAEPTQYQGSRPRRSRAEGDGMCGPSLPAGRLWEDSAAIQDRHAFRQNINDSYLHSEERREATSGGVGRAKPATPGASGKSTQLAPRQRPKQTQKQLTQQQEQYQMQQNQYEQMYQEQNTCLAPAGERSVVELFNKSRSSKSPPAHSSPRSRPHSRMENRAHMKTLNTRTEKAPSDVLVGQSAVSVQSVKKGRRSLRTRSYEWPTVASRLKQAEALQSRCGAVTNSSYIPFIVAKNTGPSYNIGVNVQQVLNGMKIQQPLKDIPLTIAHHMGLGHIPTFKTKRMSQKGEPLASKGAMNSLRLGARTVTLPSRRALSYSRLLGWYSCGDGMVPRFLRASARLDPALYQTREEGEGSAASEAPRSGQSERDERADRASAGRSARRYTQLTQLYNECQRLEQVHKGGSGNKETVRRYNEILRILRANKENMAQESRRKYCMPRKTSTNTTLVSSGTDPVERELNQSEQGEESAAGGAQAAGVSSKASVHASKSPHYVPFTEQKFEPKRSSTRAFR